MNRMRVTREWFQRYDDDDGQPLDEWYEQMVASIRYNGREYAIAQDVERFNEERARRILWLAIEDDWRVNRSQI